MNERIREFLSAENKSSAQLAEEIGVQPSGISHILSGRNNPSLDFIIKMLEKYPYISTDWLLFGKGNMYKDSQISTLFDDSDLASNNSYKKSFNPDSDKSAAITENIEGRSVEGIESVVRDRVGVKIERIVWFYSDRSFKEYFPGS